MMLSVYIVIAYFLLILSVGYLASRRIKSTGDFLVAGNKGNVLQITGSLLATILGSSALLGSCDLAFSTGWAASWWILTGAAGLLLLAFIAPKIKSAGKYTLPQLIEDQYGKEAKLIASLIIPVAWIGIIAAQIAGGSKVMNSFLGIPYQSAAWGIGLIFIFYTAMGGQISVIRTDVVQAIITITGISAVAFYLYTSQAKPVEVQQGLGFPFNEHFSNLDLLVLFLTHTTTFLVGPDIYSRLFCANSESTARKSVLFAGIILIPFAFIITSVGVFAANRFPGFDIHQGSSLITTIKTFLPEWGIGLLVAAILSGVISAASTTLLTSSVIIANTVVHNLDQKRTILVTRYIICIIGILSILLALKVTSIIQLLLLALTFFSGAFILPVLAGLFGFTNRRINSNLAMLVGGAVALTGKVIGLSGNQMMANVLIISSFLLNALILFPGGTWKELSRKKDIFEKN